MPLRVLLKVRVGAASDTAEQTKELLGKITGEKVLQALLILVLSYFTIKLVDWISISLSDRSWSGSGITG